MPRAGEAVRRGGAKMKRNPVAIAITLFAQKDVVPARNGAKTVSATTAKALTVLGRSGGFDCLVKVDAPSCAHDRPRGLFREDRFTQVDFSLDDEAGFSSTCVL